MKIIRFSRWFLPASVISLLIIIASVVGYIINGGFNLGVDFQAGLIQEVQFAPRAFSLTYDGRGNATISLDRANIYIVISGSGVEGVTHAFPFDSYRTIDALSSALRGVEGLGVSVSAQGDTPVSLLVQSAQGDPQLGQNPFVLHYLPPNAPSISIEEVRSALLSLGTVSVQVLGDTAERRFMIRMEDSEFEGAGGVLAEQIIGALEANFGVGGVAVTRADYVGSRFSKNLTDQAGLLIGLTLLIILIYSSIRFKPQYAVGAVLAIIYDGLVIVAFVVWTRMEFNTTTIAAILTILGYSLNDTIVIFDRMRETRRLYPDDQFVDILDRAITETLSRTIITTLTTMLAVLSLFIFTTGAMKDFALALLVGMISGVYTTTFIASGVVNFWDGQAKKWARKKLTHHPPAKR